jgi:hypothetical protein
LKIEALKHCIVYTNTIITPLIRKYNLYCITYWHKFVSFVIILIKFKYAVRIRTIMWYYDDTFHSNCRNIFSIHYVNIFFMFTSINSQLSSCHTCINKMYSFTEREEIDMIHILLFVLQLSIMCYTNKMLEQIHL